MSKGAREMSVAKAISGITIILAILLLSIDIIWLAFPQMQGFLSITATLTTSILLVDVTAVYVIITAQTLKESQKDREVRSIERRLERLYYPLKNIMIDCLEGAKCFRDQSKPYRNMLYLASEELRKLCDEVYESADYMALDIDGKFEMDRKVIKIEKILKREIDTLSTRLKELTTFKPKGQEAEIEESKAGRKTQV